ncbi:MAG: DUF4886 domain-containing protein [Clostridia bacterium]|nr:DUF4886 domain-containing protein [Clostridia bacterium]
MRNKNSKLRFLIAFMLVSVLAVGLTFGAADASEVTDGECGQGVSWAFADGTLTVSGSGMMRDYAYDGMPWYHLKDRITRVVISEGVTHVGDLSFYGFSGITEISLPEGLLSIGRYAFYGCRGITTAVIPESVTAIDQYAFRKTSLKSVVMTSDYWGANGSAIVGLDDPTEASKLLTSTSYKLYEHKWRRIILSEVVEVASGSCGKNVTWTLYSDGLLSILGEGRMRDYGAFNAPWEAYKNVITRVIIDEGVTAIGRCAFYGCDIFNNLSIPETLTEIGEYAFYGCRELKSVTVHAAIESIGEYAFRKCASDGLAYFVRTEGWSVDGAAVDGSALTDYESAWKLLTAQNYTKAWTAVCVHDYVETVEKAATTFEEGLASYACSYCGDSYSAVLPATKSLKLLAIGNSFSQDALEHLYIVCKDAGIEELVIGHLYIGGCSLETHYTRMVNDTAAYVFYLSDDEQKKMVDYGNGTKMTAKFGIEYTDWDYITLQQNSANSGVASTYQYLDDVISYVDQFKPKDAKYFWHMTWAYQGDSTHSSFPTYDRDQLKMYNAILSCVNSEVLTNPEIVGVVPSGTAIQNLRTSHLGDTLTRDGHHLSYGIGRYAAALTYLAAITGYDVDKITATPSKEVTNHLPCIKEGVKNAIAKPFEVTSSVDYPYVAPEEPESPDGILGTTLSPLTDADRAYLTEKGYDPDGFMLLNLDVTYNAYYDSRNDITGDLIVPTAGSTYKKFLGTQVFNRNELVVGSLIRVDAGYKYRPEGWAEGVKNTSSNRPAVVYSADNELVTVTDEWWGSFDYRGFNICKGAGSANENITIDEKDNFKIYIPVAKKSPLTAEDAEYLASIGLNPNKYMVLDYTYTLHGYYNASSSVPSAMNKSNASLNKQFLCTDQIFTRYDIPLGSVIRVTSSDYQYRPEGWITLNAKVASADRPVRVTAPKTVVDVAWWGEWGYRAFNVQTKSSKVMTEAGADALRIYVPVDNKYSELTAEDIAYLEGMGLNPDDYKVLNYDYTLAAHYNSTKSADLYQDGTAFVKRFAATEMFTRNDLTVGSIIRMTKTGYQYRPDAWTALDKKTDPRPGNVTAECVTVTEEWWGEYNYCGINISRTTDTNAVTAEDVAVLRIYVKIK